MRSGVTELSHTLRTPLLGGDFPARKVREVEDSRLVLPVIDRQTLCSIIREYQRDYFKIGGGGEGLLEGK